MYVITKYKQFGFWKVLHHVILKCSFTIEIDSIFSVPSFYIKSAKLTQILEITRTLSHEGTLHVVSVLDYSSCGFDMTVLQYGNWANENCLLLLFLNAWDCQGCKNSRWEGDPHENMGQIMKWAKEIF